MKGTVKTLFTIIIQPVESKKNPGFISRVYVHAAEQNRTVDTRIFSPLLYRLSYSGNYVVIYIIGPEKSQYKFLKYFKIYPVKFSFPDE